ncbi:MAG TPA: 23S rRNA (guanosine(2251)-2'-O)-methyltransferase RlmB, partial [Candidatus Limiplasma sp.]|nr:23S rRNA (guanosine(2251)-2'-O)-methyltransferase RlmB [Candidatus Limiplasma sp.]
NRAPRGDRPAYGGDRPVRGDSRPSRDGQAPYQNRAPRGDRPAYGGDRPVRSDSRPPRDGQAPYQNRAPRGDRPMYGGDRPAYGGDRPARGDSRPPRDGQAPYQNRAPRGDRPAYGGDRPARGDNRPPRDGQAPYQNRAPRGDRPAYGGDRTPRDNSDFRYAPGGQQPYRSRGTGATPKPYNEQRRERRDVGPAPRPYEDRRGERREEPRGYEPYRYEAPARPPKPVYDAPEPSEEEVVPNENLLSGRNPIREALKSGRDIEKLLVARGDLSGSAREIVAMAKEKRVPVQEVDRARLDAITTNHQGMLAFASAYQYHTVEEMLALAKERGEAPFLVILDGITDPHNLGAIIRTAECAGAHGVIVQERRAVGLTPAAVKASAGAIEHIMVARVVNLVATLEELKKQNIWVYAADMQGEDYASIDFKGGVALVIGSEGEGVSRLVLEKSDKRVSLPIRGKLDSLNASVAAGILLYAVLRTR